MTKDDLSGTPLPSLTMAGVFAAVFLSIRSIQPSIQSGRPGRSGAHSGRRGVAQWRGRVDPKRR